MTVNRKQFVEPTGGYKHKRERWFCAREWDAIGLQFQWKLAQDSEGNKQTMKIKETLSFDWRRFSSLDFFFLPFFFCFSTIQVRVQFLFLLLPFACLLKLIVYLSAFGAAHICEYTCECSFRFKKISGILNP